MIAEQPLNDQDILSGLVRSFNLARDEIMVRRNHDDFTNPDNAKLVCLASPRNEGFRCVLSVYAYFDASSLDEISVVTKFARTCKTDLLISDDSIDPYTMILVRPTGDLVNVNLDADLLDEKCEYHVSDQL